MKLALKKYTLLMVAFLVASCSTLGHFTHFKEKYPATLELAVVELFQDSVPSRPFIEISRLDVHIEKTHFVNISLDDAIPELRKQARLSGAHAIINIKESSSSMGETSIYHVIATGIRYQE